VVSQVWRDIQINLKPILALLLYKSVDTTEDHKLEMNEAGLKTLSGFIAKYHQYQAKITAYKNRD
jgi:hypothetical protein